jgi:hypothetical protein
MLGGDEPSEIDMHVAQWHPLEASTTTTGYAAHLHGRDLRVVPDPAHRAWHWRVATPHDETLAEGDAPTRIEAEVAAEDEATAVHPPTPHLIDQLLS